MRQLKQSDQDGKSIQKLKLIAEIKEERPSPSVKTKSKTNVQLNPKVTVENIERKTSKIPVPVKNSQQKKVKLPSRLQIIGKLGQTAIPSGDQKTIQLRSEYVEKKRLRKAEAQDRSHKRRDKSRGPPEPFGKSHPHAVQSTITKSLSTLKLLKTLLIRNEKTNGLKQRKQK